MSRDDYKKIAGAMNKLFQEHGSEGVPPDALLKSLCRVFKADNSSFKAELFVKACIKDLVTCEKKCDGCCCK